MLHHVHHIVTTFPASAFRSLASVLRPAFFRWK